MSRTSFNPSRATPCIICEVKLDHFSNNRLIPDYLCSKCFRLYRDDLDQPWMKYLMNQERYRRMKKQRRARSGRSMDEVSLDELSDAGFTIPHTVLRDQYERTQQGRRR